MSTVRTPHPSAALTPSPQRGEGSLYPALPLHPLCTLFPPMDRETFAAFVQDVADNGLRDPIVTLGGHVLDGRNRQAACAELGLVADLVEYDGDDPLAFVLSKNLARRHLDASQRAMVAARLVTWQKGMNQHSATPANLPVSKASRIMNVSERAVASARAIREYGSQALIDAISGGSISVHAGEARVDMEDRDVRLLIAAGERAVLKQAKILRGGQRTRAHDVVAQDNTSHVYLSFGVDLADFAFGEVGSLIARLEADLALCRAALGIVVVENQATKIRDALTKTQIGDLNSMRGDANG